MRDRLRRRAEQQRRQMIGDAAVDFFRLGAAERPQASLDMEHGNVQLRRDQCGGQGRIGVAVNKKSVGPVGGQNRFQRDQHAPGHIAVAAAADAQVVIGRRQAKLTEEHVGHAVVEMLTRVDQGFLDARVPEGARHRSGLDELGARPDDGCDAGHAPTASFNAVRMRSWVAASR